MWALGCELFIINLSLNQCWTFIVEIAAHRLNSNGRSLRFGIDMSCSRSCCQRFFGWHSFWIGCAKFIRDKKLRMWKFEKFVKFLIARICPYMINRSAWRHGISSIQIALSKIVWIWNRFLLFAFKYCWLKRLSPYTSPVHSRWNLSHEYFYLLSCKKPLP